VKKNTGHGRFRYFLEINLQGNRGCSTMPVSLSKCD
jgi:hypothetical protein